MTDKEYKEILEEIDANTFPYVYKALDGVKPHEETIEVIAYEDIIDILLHHIQGKKK